MRPCPCGSGEPSIIEYDDPGLRLIRVCRKCRSEKLPRYRPEVLTNPSDECDGTGIHIPDVEDE